MKIYINFRIPAKDPWTSAAIGLVEIEYPPIISITWGKWITTNKNTGILEINMEPGQLIFWGPATEDGERINLKGSAVAVSEAKIIEIDPALTYEIFRNTFWSHQIKFLRP